MASNDRTRQPRVIVRQPFGLSIVLLTMVAATQSIPLLNGTGCIVQEPLYNVTFDFNALSSDLNHHVTAEVDGERFFFNVCEEDTDSSKKGEPRAYLMRKGKKITLGYEPHLKLDNGRLQFSFIGDPCGSGANGQKYTLDIILLCSYERTPQELRVIPYTPDQCRYFIFWDTSLACQPLPAAFVDNRCSVREGNTSAGRHEYSLLPLAGDNHEVSLPDGTHVVLSICKPVRYGHLTMCPPGSGACLVNGTDYRDIGQAVANPTIDEKGRLVMDLRSRTDPNQRTLIVFECGKSVTADSTPVYRGMRSNGTHEFLWRTRLACRDTEPCTVSNPITGTRYDLTPLANRTYTLTSHDNRTFELGVCHIPASSRCPLDSGACEVTGTQSVGLGVMADDLRFDTTGAPYLVYQSGAVCDAATERRWETRLEFICETDPVEGGRGGKVVPPTVVENSDCLLVVHFETVLVCEPALMACGAYNESAIDHYVDLTPLVDSTRNYEAHVDAAVSVGSRRFFLNVCRPLVPQYGLSCRGGAAACEAILEGATARNETTLGFPDVSLVVAGDTVLMKYLRGDPCRADPLTNLSSTVTFRCAPSAGFGVPTLVEIEHSCHYRFDWATAVICPPELALPFDPTDCSVYNPATAVRYGLRTLLGELSPCDKEPVPSVHYSTGSLDIRFNVSDPTNCGMSRGVKTYNVTVVCGRDTPLDRTASSSCFEIIQKQTLDVCPLVGRNASTGDETKATTSTTVPTSEPTHEAVTTSKPITTTEPMGTKLKPEGGIGVFGIVLICVTVFTTVGAGSWYLIWRHPERRQQLYSMLICRGNGRNGFPSTMYSRVDNSEVSSLLLNPSNVMSDSDDDMLI